jgi:hypothetical protein
LNKYAADSNLTVIELPALLGYDLDNKFAALKDTYFHQNGMKLNVYLFKEKRQWIGIQKPINYDE